MYKQRSIRPHFWHFLEKIGDFIETTSLKIFEIVFVFQNPIGPQLLLPLLEKIQFLSKSA